MPCYQITPKKYLIVKTCIYTHNFMVASVLPDHRAGWGIRFVWLKNTKRLQEGTQGLQVKTINSELNGAD